MTDYSLITNFSAVFIKLKQFFTHYLFFSVVHQAKASVLLLITDYFNHLRWGHNFWSYREMLQVACDKKGVVHT